MNLEIKKGCVNYLIEYAKLDNEILSIKIVKLIEMKKNIGLFEKDIKESSDNKTLLYGKVQGTYVDSTKKHSLI